MTQTLASETWWQRARWWAPLEWIIAPEPSGYGFDHEATLRALALRLEGALENARNVLDAPHVAHSVYRPLLQGRGDVADCRYSFDGAIARVGAADRAVLEEVLAEALRHAENVRAGLPRAFVAPALEAPREVVLRNLNQLASGGSYFARVDLRAAPSEQPGVWLYDASDLAQRDRVLLALLREAIMDEARDLMLRDVALTMTQVQIHMVDYKTRAWQMAGRAAVRRAILGEPPGR